MWNETGAAGADHELSSIDRQMERIVAEAEAAATTVRSNLEEAKRARAEMLREAESEVAELRMEAEAFAAETREEAERNRIRTEAMAEELLGKARAEAEQIRLAAIAEAAETRTRGEAIHALLVKQLPNLSELRKELAPLLNGDAAPAIEVPAMEPPAGKTPDWAPLIPPAPQPERFLHPSSLSTMETTPPAPALHVVEPIEEHDADAVGEPMAIAKPAVGDDTAAVEYGVDRG